MKTWFTLIALSLFALMLVGCGEIEEMIEGATERTITAYQTVHNTTSERSPRSVAIAEDIIMTSGQTRPLGTVSLEEMTDPLEVSRLGIGTVFFYLRLAVHNRGNSAARLELSIAPNGANQTATVVAIFNLAAGQTLIVDEPSATQFGAALHRNLTTVYDQLDDNLVIAPSLRVTGGDSSGIEIAQIKVAATPTYWRSENYQSGKYEGYKDNIDGIHDASLTGQMTNLGAGAAEVRIYVSVGDVIDSENDLIAHAVLQPGETIQGEDMLLEGGGERIKQTFKDAIDGDLARYDLSIVSAESIAIDSDSLQLEIKIDVKVDI
ncbi:MAG TPA: hypothetical protein PK961_05190 [bacterium]|nr:hypothetical protein [bacterium]